METTIKQAILFATENSKIDNFSRTVVRYDLLMTKLAELSKVEKDNYLKMYNSGVANAVLEKATSAEEYFDQHFTK